MDASLLTSLFGPWFQELRSLGPLTTVAIAFREYREWASPEWSLRLGPGDVSELNALLAAQTAPAAYIMPAPELTALRLEEGCSTALKFALEKALLLDPQAPLVWVPGEDRLLWWRPLEGSRRLFGEFRLRHDDAVPLAAAATAGFISPDETTGGSLLEWALYPLRTAHGIARELLAGPGGPRLPLDPRPDLLAREGRAHEVVAPNRSIRRTLTRWALAYGAAAGSTQADMGAQLEFLDVANSSDAGERQVRRLLRSFPDAAPFPRKRGRPPKPREMS